jgi:hypothetical protein
MMRVAGTGRQKGVLDDVGVAETGGDVEGGQAALVDFVDVAAPAARWRVVR